MFLPVRPQTTGNRKAKFFSVVIYALLLFSGAPLNAQYSSKIPRIGFLVPTSASDFSNLVEGCQEALRELGYVEGR